jgi:glycosyltransferase involved in cell wall biosynthesis
MLTAIIETKNSEEMLARTLGPLVSGAVNGLLRDVLVYDTGSSDQTWKVAEQAGCVFISGCSLLECIGGARGDWILLLQPGARLDATWIDAVERHIGMVQSPARFTPSREGRPALISRFFKRSSPLANGLLINKRQAMALASNANSGEALARGLAVRRMSAHIMPSSSL